MSDTPVFDRIMIQLRETCRYYTGYPKDLGPSRVIHFTSERQFIQLLHQGYPVVVAFTIKGNYTKHLDKVLEEAAVVFYPHIKYMRVECPKYPGFCITRQKKEYPFVELFHSPEQQTFLSSLCRQLGQKLLIQMSRSIQLKFFRSITIPVFMVLENFSSAMEFRCQSQSELQSGATSLSLHICLSSGSVFSTMSSFARVFV